MPQGDGVKRMESEMNDEVFVILARPREGNDVMQVAHHETMEAAASDLLTREARYSAWKFWVETHEYVA